MRTRLEVFQRLDSRFRGNDNQGGNDEGDAFPWFPYPKLGLLSSKGSKFPMLTPVSDKSISKNCYSPWMEKPAAL